MSVICFGAGELGNLVAERAGDCAERKAAFARLAETYSKDNFKCFSYQYRGRSFLKEAGFADAATILRFASQPPDLERATMTAHLLRYNLYANDGRDFGTPDSLQACAALGALPFGEKGVDEA